MNELFEVEIKFRNHEETWNFEINTYIFGVQEAISSVWSSSSDKSVGFTCKWRNASNRSMKSNDWEHLFHLFNFSVRDRNAEITLISHHCGEICKIINGSDWKISFHLARSSKIFCRTWLWLTSCPEKTRLYQLIDNLIITKRMSFEPITFSKHKPWIKYSNMLIETIESQRREAADSTNQSDN